MSWLWFVVIATVIVSVVLILVNSNKTKEGYENMIPIVLSFEDTLIINTDQESYDYYISDQLKENFDVELKVNKEDVIYFMCNDPKCKYKYSHKVENSKYAGPALINNQIDSGYYIRVIPNPLLYPDIEQYTDNDLDTRADATATWNTVHIRLVLNSFVKMNDIVSVKDIYTDALAKNNIQVFVDKSTNVIDNYSLNICKWDERTKSALCQELPWEMRKSLPDIAIGKSRIFDMIRLEKKSV